MRVERSIKNIRIGVISQIIIIILGFLSRKIFLDSLGEEYLGVNGLLTNVLSALVLLEGGIGISITYNLYKPLAENDREKIIALIQLFKKAYSTLGIILLIISTILYPVVKNQMITGASVDGIFIVYFLFVFKSVISYFFAHKWAVINADQRGYILVKNNLIFQVISIVGKIIILILTKNYILYLGIEFILFVGQNIVNTKIVNEKYPYILEKKKVEIEKEIKLNIVKNVKAMFLQNIGSYIINSTDNIVISTFISTALVGVYSNYTMVMGQLAALLAPVINGISNSVGNLIAMESKEKSYDIFEITFLISFWITSFSTIFLYNLLNPFIIWWLGEKYLLLDLTFIVLIFNFYMSGMKNIILIFKSKAGLFSEDKYAPLIEGGINLFLSLILIDYLGIAGVFLGTAFSYILISFWNQPRILFKKYFKISVMIYLKKYFNYTLLGGVVGIITSFLCNLISGTSFIQLCLKGIICVFSVNVIYLIVFWNNKNFEYLKRFFINKIGQIK